MISSSKPLNPSGDDESHDDSMDHETLKVSFFKNFQILILRVCQTSPNAQKFANFASYQNLATTERTPSVNSSDESADNEVNYGLYLLKYKN